MTGPDDGAPGMAGALEAPGLWVEMLADPRRYRGRPALFLDRDGTINVDTGYPSRPAEVELFDDILPLIAAANRSDIAVVVVSNQSGIARGLFGWAEFAAVNRRVLDRLRAAGCQVDLVLACGYHAEGQGALRHADHPMRKPNPGMLLRAAELAGIDLPASILVGDKESDVEAGRRAGLSRGFRLPDPPGDRREAIAAAGAALARLAVRHQASDLPS